MADRIEQENIPLDEKLAQEKQHLKEKIQDLKSEWLLTRESMSKKLSAFESRLEGSLNNLVDDI